METPEADSLSQRLLDGDHTALAELFETNRERFLRLIGYRMDRRLNQRLDHADVLQEVYISLSKRLHCYDSKMSPYSWVRLEIVDRLIELHRMHVKAGKRDVRKERSINQKAGPDESSAEIAAILADSHPSIGGIVAGEEISRIIKSTMEAMDEKDREIIVMRIFEGVSNQEAAEILGLSPNGASSRFSRAMDKLQKEVMKNQPTTNDSQ